PSPLWGEGPGVRGDVGQVGNLPSEPGRLPTCPTQQAPPPPTPLPRSGGEGSTTAERRADPPGVFRVTLSPPSPPRPGRRGLRAGACEAPPALEARPGAGGARAGRRTDPGPGRGWSAAKARVPRG